MEATSFVKVPCVRKCAQMCTDVHQRVHFCAHLCTNGITHIKSSLQIGYFFWLGHAHVHLSAHEVCTSVSFAPTSAHKCAQM